MSNTASRRTALGLGAAGVLATTPARAHHGEATRVAGRREHVEEPNLLHGFSRERLARLEPAFAREAERGSFPGCVALITRHGEPVLHQAYGHQDAARTRPMPLDAVFLLASMTKPLVSTLAMMLIEEGHLKLSDPIANVLPELRDVKVEARPAGQPAELVAPNRPIQVHDLLRHTAGFVYGEAAPSARIRDAYAEANIEARTGPITTDAMLAALGRIPLAHQPGSTFHYSISVDVLGLLLERVMRQPLDTLLAERLTGPLGMRDTTWFVDPARRARVAEAPTTDPQTARMWREYRIEQNPAGTSYFKGGAGLVSTAADYVRFAHMIEAGGVLDGRRYLASPTVRFMLSDHIAGMAGGPTASTGPGYGFGLGFAVRLADGMAVAPGSTGDAMWAGAWGTVFTLDRAEGLVAILMAQGASARGQTRMLFKNLVYGAMVESERG